MVKYQNSNNVALFALFDWRRFSNISHSASINTFFYTGSESDSNKKIKPNNSLRISRKNFVFTRDPIWKNKKGEKSARAKNVFQFFTSSDVVDFRKRDFHFGVKSSDKEKLPAEFSPWKTFRREVANLIPRDYRILFGKTPEKYIRKRFRRGQSTLEARRLYTLANFYSIFRVNTTLWKKEAHKRRIKYHKIYTRRNCDNKFCIHISSFSIEEFDLAQWNFVNIKTKKTDPIYNILILRCKHHKSTKPELIERRAKPKLHAMQIRTKGYLTIPTRIGDKSWKRPHTLVNYGVQTASWIHRGRKTSGSAADFV